MEPGLIEEIRQATNENHVLGDARFCREIEAMLQRREHREKRGGRPGVSENRGLSTI
jgi:hypothetical protein